MSNACDITVDIIDEDTVIGDSLNIINNNFKALENISCAILTSLSKITVNSSRIPSLSGKEGITVKQEEGVYTVSETYCPPWHVSVNNIPLYAEMLPSRFSRQALEGDIYTKYIEYVVSQNLPIYNNDNATNVSAGITLIGKKHSDGVIMGDGNVFFVPHTYNRGIIYNPNTNNFTITVSALGIGFESGCLLPDGRVCLLPGTNKFIHIWDPQRETLFKSAIDLSIIGKTKPYNGGIMLGDGKIMLIPFERNDGTVIYDPVTDTITDITSTYFTTVSAKSFYSGQLLIDGTVVILTPYNSTFALRVETFAPYNVYPAHALGGVTGGNGAFSGSVMLPDSKVFFVPYNSTRAAIYDPITDTLIHTSAVYPGNAAYRSGTLTTDGRICMLPYGSTSMAYFDSRTYNTSYSLNMSGAAFKYSDVVQLENGELLGIPYEQGTAVVINIGMYQGFSRAAITGIFQNS